jgi:hypothetical protein
MSPDHPSPDVIGLRAELAGHAFELVALRLQLLLRKANFNPAQLRIPAGQPRGGRWTHDPSTSWRRNNLEGTQSASM